jgi:hypothetical protein
VVKKKVEVCKQFNLSSSPVSNLWKKRNDFICTKNNLTAKQENEEM